MKRMNDEGAMSCKGMIIIGLALIVVALLIAIPLANSSLITGNDIIFQGEYEISDKYTVGSDSSVQMDFPMTNGEIITFFEHNVSGAVYGKSMRYYNIEDATYGTIWEHNDSNGLELSLYYDLKGDMMAFIVEDTNTAGECQYYSYDISTGELTFVFNISSEYANAIAYGVKVYGDYILWGARIGIVDTYFVCDIRTKTSFEVIELNPTENFHSTGMDIWENQVVISAYNLTYGAVVLARSNILTPHPEEVTWILDPEDYEQENFAGVSIYGDKIATVYTPQFGRSRIAVIENFTSADPSIKLVDPYNDIFHLGYLEYPYIYENFVMWYKYTTDYESGWIYLYDTGLNQTWRIDTSARQWGTPSGIIPAPHMQGNVICWGETISYQDWFVHYLTIGQFRRDVIAPKSVQALNLNGVYLLSITATLLVGLVATEWITEGGLPSLGRSGTKGKQPPEYREI